MSKDSPWEKGEELEQEAKKDGPEMCQCGEMTEEECRKNAERENVLNNLSRLEAVVNAAKALIIEGTDKDEEEFKTLVDAAFNVVQQEAKLCVVYSLLDAPGPAPLDKKLSSMAILLEASIQPLRKELNISTPYDSDLVQADIKVYADKLGPDILEPVNDNEEPENTTKH